jgi:hypothetical protein
VENDLRKEARTLKDT